jgi:hypothetical protein
VIFFYGYINGKGVIAGYAEDVLDAEGCESLNDVASHCQLGACCSLVSKAH